MLPTPTGTQNRSANEHPDFPAGGKMSQLLDALRVGDAVEVKGPVGHFVYEGRGGYTLGGKKGALRSDLECVCRASGSAASVLPACSFAPYCPPLLLLFLPLLSN